MSTLGTILTFLEQYALTLYKTQVTTFTLSVVADNGDGTWRFTASANISGVFAGMWIYVGSGPNNGYYKITNVSTNYVDCTATGLTAQASAYGTVTVYDVREAKLNQSIAFWQSYIQKITGLSFSGIETRNEIHDGSGYEELMLDRRPIIAVQNITLLTLPNTVYSIPVSSIEVIQDRGVLRVRAINLEAYSFLAPIWPKGRSNIKITYTCGYASMPEDVLTALTYLVSAAILGEQAGISGGGLSLSVVAWSKSFGPRGRYGVIRNDLVSQANSILRKYSTAVVGN